MVPNKVAIWISLINLADRANGPVRALTWISQHHFRAVSLQHVLAFHGRIFRKAQLYVISFISADHGVRDASVAAGGIQNNLVAGQLTRSLAIQDHIERRTILHRSAGVEKLTLAVDLDAWQIARNSLHADERRVADHAQKVGCFETRNRRRAGGGDRHISLFLWYHLFVGRQWGINPLTV